MERSYQVFSLEDRPDEKFKLEHKKMLSTRKADEKIVKLACRKVSTVTWIFVLYPTCQGIHIFKKAGEIDLEEITLFQKLHCQEEPHYLLAWCSGKI